MRRAVVLGLLGVLAAALAGCDSSHPSAPASSAPAARASATSSPVASPAATAWSFTVSGNRPVVPNDSQATSLTTPGDGCSTFRRVTDEALGDTVVNGFAQDGYPTAASLLRHFLGGSGTAVGYPASSAIARAARGSSAFAAVRREVEAAVLGQLRDGRHLVELSAAQLPTVAFENDKTDLYWAFRGTQGLTVTGHGTRAGGRYAGTLTYVIRDSYGFPASDTLQGIGTRMRYLQTACGAPQHPGGARWFPDTVTVSVPFSEPET